VLFAAIVEVGLFFAGPIELNSIFEKPVIDCYNRLGCVMPFSARIGEAQIDVFHVMFFDQIHHFF
jgi:hypothetical protein